MKWPRVSCVAEASIIHRFAPPTPGASERRFSGSAFYGVRESPEVGGHAIRHCFGQLPSVILKSLVGMEPHF